MTTAHPVPTSGAHPPQMASAADSRPDPTVPAPATAVRAEPGRWSKLTDNPLTILGTAAVGLLTILGTVAVGLLISTLNGIDNRLGRLEDKVDAGFAAIDARFAEQDAKIAELDLRLTTQIAELDGKLTTQIAELDGKLTTQIAELDLRLTTQIAELDLRLTTQIAELDLRLTTQIAELDRKLTALIAALNATDQIQAALEGRLLDPGADNAEPSSPGPG